MASIDLNSDLGENTPDRNVSDDESMLELVTSVNVSCGFHAGTPDGIRKTLAGAVERRVVIGAHPSYRDYDGFGRRDLDVEPATLQAEIEYQLGALTALASAVGGRVRYVKPHGALYNRIAADRARADAVAAAVCAVDPRLVLLGLAGSAALDAGAHAGLQVAAEAFADRAYLPDGRLVPRSDPAAVLHDPAAVAERMLRLTEHGVIRAIDGSDVRIDADSICVHGDSPSAVAMAREVRRALTDAGVAITPFTEL